MRAVVLAGAGQAQLVDRPAPSAGAGERLVRVRRAAICATDRKAMRTGKWAPRVLGHEFAGELADGTRVAVHPEVSCGDCPTCEAGLENRCPSRISIGLGRDGGFAEQVVVPADRILPIASSVDMDAAALLEPLACCIHAVDLLAPIEIGTAVVVGAGAMGVIAMWALQAAGWKVAVLQRSEPRRRQARDLGADAVAADPQQLLELLGGPVDAAVVSAPGPQALLAGLEVLRPGGAAHILAGSPDPVPVDANLVHYRHLHLVGSTGSTMATYRRAHDLVVRGEVPLARLPRELVPLDRVPSALADEPASPALKTLVAVDEVTR